MGLKRTIIKAAKTAFKVFKDAVYESQLVVVTDDGFDDVTESFYPVNIIFNEVTKEDMENSVFTGTIQPTDYTGLILGDELTIDIKTVDLIRINGVDYSIVETTTDPFKVLYTLLLRGGS